MESLVVFVMETATHKFPSLNSFMNVLKKKKGKDSYYQSRKCLNLLVWYELKSISDIYLEIWSQMVQHWYTHRGVCTYKADYLNSFTYSINTLPPPCVCDQHSYIFMGAWGGVKLASELCNENIIMHLKWNVCGRKFPWNICAAVILGLEAYLRSLRRGVHTVGSVGMFKSLLHDLKKKSYNIMEKWNGCFFLCCGASCWMIVLLQL